jgi:hypothetical protein
MIGGLFVLRCLQAMIRAGKAVMLAGVMALVAIAADAQEATIGNTCIYSPAQVSDFLIERGGLTYVSFPGAHDWVVLADGATYCPMPLEDVASAVSGISFPADCLRIDILILPVPRRDVPSSSAEGNVIFLSPGRIAYPKQHVHYTVTHEIGHVVHHVLMPDSREDLWRAYAGLREVAYASPSSGGAHACRLHEIFAEDFRVLFGTDLARCGGQVENHDIAPPLEVEGLKDFFLSLLSRSEGRPHVLIYPNPFQSNLVVRAVSADGCCDLSEVALYDVRGRLIQVVTPQSGGRGQVAWNGLDRLGGRVAPGLYFAAVKTSKSVSVYKIVKSAE